MGWLGRTRGGCAWALRSSERPCDWCPGEGWGSVTSPRRSGVEVPLVSVPGRARRARVERDPPTELAADTGRLRPVVQRDLGKRLRELFLHRRRGGLLLVEVDLGAEGIEGVVESRDRDPRRVVGHGRDLRGVIGEVVVAVQ